MREPAFNPPAKVKRLTAVEARTGLRFPEELRAMYLQHDGASVRWLPNGMWLRTLNEVEQDWLDFGRLHDELAEDGEAFDEDISSDGKHFTNVYDRARLPIATRQDGPEMYLDFRPGPQGSSGQVLYLINECDYIVVATSFSEFIQQYLPLREAHQLVLDEGGYQGLDVGWPKA
ncbi:MAG: SMI1/KNR4 family protein [Polyangiaceae bacterium]|jgi:cell wall assembly regulator SMI1|nr:SMI1/KNR4 family protein [Polyangiaceae bacterium]